MSQVAILTSGQSIDVNNIKKGKINSTICGWSPPQYGDLGETALHAVLSVIAFAVAVWSAFEQMRIFNMRYQLASGYADIAEADWNRFNTRYKPVEAFMIAECMAEGPVSPDYPLSRSRDEAGLAYGRAQGLASLERNSALYHVCPDASRFRAREVQAAAYGDDLVNLGFRAEEVYALGADDMRFSRRANLLNLGRDLMSQSAAYGQVAGAILGAAANAQAATTEGAMRLVGYLRNRGDTSYPTWLSQNSSPGAILSTLGKLDVGGSS